MGYRCWQGEQDGSLCPHGESYGQTLNGMPGCSFDSQIACQKSIEDARIARMEREAGNGKHQKKGGEK